MTPDQGLISYTDDALEKLYTGTAIALGHHHAKEISFTRHIITMGN